MPNYDFPSRPVADPGAIISGPNYRFTIINDVVLRYEWSVDGIFEDRASTFAINRNFSQRPKPLIKDNEGGLEIITPSFHLSYDKKRFSPNGFVVDFRSKTTLWGAQWRYGEQTEENLGGTARTLDNVDGRCDMGFGILSKAGYAVIDDSSSMLFDGHGFVTVRQPGDRIDGYLFSYGRDYKAAMNAFFAISGHTPKLPRWALGNWWSRYYKYSADSYLRLMDQFQAEHVPLSVAVMDMDWHLVRDDIVEHSGWTGYTWDKKLFPDPVKFAEELHKRDLKMTLNDHPHAGVHSHEEQYADVARYMDHDTSEQAPIHFDPTNPKFIDAYLSVLHRNLEKQGCDFWWIDWQQGAFSRIPGFDPLWLLNHFQFLDQQHTAGEDKAIVFSRYAGPGSHRYPVGFSGDTIVTWDSFAFQPEFTATASNIGYGWWSHDIGGHMLGARDDELVARWVQFGVFSPIMRLHSSDSAWSSKEPWEYRWDACRTMKFFLQLRHRMVPYLYSSNTELAHNDEPLVRPLYWEFPMREEAYQHPNQYFFGPSLVVAPIVQPRDSKTQHAPVTVWLPPSTPHYIDIFTGTVYDSDREIEMWRPLQTMPVLAPEGAILPLDAVLEPSNGGYNPEAFEILVVPGHDGSFTLFEDNRDDRDYHAPTANETDMPSQDYEREIELVWNQTAGCLSVDAPAGRQWVFRFLSFIDTKFKARVFVNNSAVPSVQVTVEDKATSFPGTVIRLPKDVTKDKCTIIVQLSSNPQLRVSDYRPKIQALVHDFQMDYSMKDRIFSTVCASQPVSTKMARLLSLGLETSILGPIAELILADDRKA